MRALIVLACLVVTIVASGCSKGSKSPTSPAPTSSNLVVTPDTLTVTNTSLVGAVSVSTNATAGQSWHVGGKPTWAAVDPDSGVATTTGEAVVITADTTGMAYGDHWGSVVMLAASDTATLVLRLVNPAPATLWVSPDTVAISDTSPTGTVSLSTSSATPQDWNVTAKPTWLDVAPASGQATRSGQTITVTGNVTGLAYGITWGSVTIASVTHSASFDVKLVYPPPPANLWDLPTLWWSRIALPWARLPSPRTRPSRSTGT